MLDSLHGRIKAGLSDNESMIERALCQLATRIGFESNGADLHMDDGLVTVAALGCGRQADNISCLDLGKHPFKRDGRQVVAFVDDHLPILGDDVVH